jgi:hypothetical protein
MQRMQRNFWGFSSSSEVRAGRKKQILFVGRIKARSIQKNWLALPKLAWFLRSLAPPGKGEVTVAPGFSLRCFRNLRVAATVFAPLQAQEVEPGNEICSQRGRKIHPRKSFIIPQRNFSFFFLTSFLSEV